MSPSRPPPFRFNYMGGFGDDNQRSAKRLRFDQAGAGQPAPPSDGHQDNIPDTGGTSQNTDAEWLFSHPIMLPSSLPIIPGSVPGVVQPHPDALMPLNPSVSASMLCPMDNSMAPAPWHASFNVAPNPADISAVFPQGPQPAMLPIPELQPLQHPAPPYPTSQWQLPRQPNILPRLQPNPLPNPLPNPRPRQTQPSRSPPTISEPVQKDQRRRKSRVKPITNSPFSDCIDSFGNTFAPQHFFRPRDGKVNGYIKFNWSTPKEDKQPSRISEVTDDVDDSLTSVPATYSSNHGSDLALQRRFSVSHSTPSVTTLAGSDSPFSTASTLVSPLYHHPLPAAKVKPYFDGGRKEEPRLVPAHFGLHTKMDTMDRKLFIFYVQNWCPGRSVLRRTNLWLTDFARMHEGGVLAAIHSLAGIYIHDYLPDEKLRRRINQKFALAEARFSSLLQDSHNLGETEASELITLASLLSMQDVVLTERRLQKPYHPRWLTGFKQAETMLQLTDPGSRFYKESNVQVNALRLSQSVIVGRAVILAQPMMPLPSLATFDPIAETSRFGFLLYGSEQEMYEIHGGCGFSKRLLHIFSQVAYCSARMLQDSETPVVPVSADMLYGQLENLNQWSGEYVDWEAAQQRQHQPIEWIRQMDETYIVQQPKEMTEVTAEAWRLAGMVYLQCRLFRLPRNHPQVVANIADLAKSISIMPTSGPVFTAQAPLLPVFFLGLLATVPDHVEVSHAWFQQVIHTPVRSSVPPLYKTLQRIQSWIDIEVPLPASNTELPPSIAERQPWWERMVSRVQEKETEVLCLT
ncbi:hypothetical protein A9K55_000592 [Cordyceps militaris]|uniref:Uncharacterized protein n=1 Tax=Cordyceps militaris TaxID=73501 RepID=A0A2H4SV91_CORMI|nr:hypothetical protein A9K55_000592 [Cordyceps militaris]